MNKNYILPASSVPVGMFFAKIHFIIYLLLDITLNIFWFKLIEILPYYSTPTFVYLPFKIIKKYVAVITIKIKTICNKIHIEVPTIYKIILQATWILQYNIIWADR